MKVSQTLLALLLLSSALFAEPVVVVSDNPFDLAVAELLRDRVNASLVVLEDGELNESTVTELIMLNPERVYIVGGLDAVSWEVESLFGASIGGRIDSIWHGTSSEGVEVIRFHGSDRYKTSWLVAEEWKQSKKVYLVHGHDPVGLERAFSQAKREGAPILYYNPYHVPPLIKELESRIRALGAEDIILTTSPYISKPEMVTNRKLLRSEVHATQVLNITPREQAEAAIHRAEMAVERTKLFRDAAVQVYKSRMTPEGSRITKEWRGRNVTFQELRVRALRQNSALRAAEEALNKAKEALESGLYGEAFVLAARTVEHSRRARLEITHMLRTDERRDLLQATPEEELTPAQAILRVLHWLGPLLTITEPPPPPHAPQEFVEKWKQRMNKKMEIISEIQQHFRQAKAELRDGNQTHAREQALKALRAYQEYRRGGR